MIGGPEAGQRHARPEGILACIHVGALNPIDHPTSRTPVSGQSFRGAPGMPTQMLHSHPCQASQQDARARAASRMMWLMIQVLIQSLSRATQSHHRKSLSH